MMSITKRIITVIAAVLTLAGGFAFTAYADWYDDVSSGTYTEIKGDGFVAETFNGVDALYSDISTRYQCNELVMRYYEQVYGLDIIAYPGGIIMLSDGYEFVTPDYPHEGDIVFAPSKFRKNKSDHWAIVKSCENGKITLFEQNVVYNGRAGTGRTVKYPSGNYYVYTAQKLSGSASDTVTSAVTEETATAAAAVTESITACVTEKRADTGLAAINRTTAVFTTKAQTTVPESTAGAEKETAKQSEKMTAEPVTRTADPSGKQTAADTESVYGYTVAETAENGGETVTAVSDEYCSDVFGTAADVSGDFSEVPPVIYDDIKRNINKKPLIAAFAALFAVSAAAVIAVIIRKK